MKNLEDIENLLKESKLPDQDFSGLRSNLWQQILREKKEKKKRLSLFMKWPPWVWSLASILLIILCLLWMTLLCDKI